MADYTVDVIVVGGGVMGCAAAYHLAKDGQRVMLLERFAIGNRSGSSHGASRLFRLLHDGTDYVQLARAAYSLWRELETESDGQLLQQVNGLDLGSPHTLEGFRTTMQAAGVSFEQLDRDETMRRFPHFALPEDTIGFYQPDYGLLAADRCVATLAAQARQHGATIVEGQTVQHISASSSSVQVRTDQAAYNAERLILSVGSWMRPLMRQLHLDLPLTVTKEMDTFYRPSDPAAFMPDHFPIFRHHATGMAARWGNGFPIFEHAGVKIVLDCTGRVVDPDDPDRSVDPSQLDMVRAYVASILPTLGDEIIETETCRYTMTPDEDFILDRHPAHPQIVIASPCSGHGFKFAPLIGRILADLALRGATDYNIERFRLNRPALKNQSG
jgi:monomeric sarcosine oxidase